MRQEKEEALDKKTKDYILLNKQYEDSLKTADNLRKESEKFYQRLMKSEKEFDQVKLHKESLEK